MIGLPKGGWGRGYPIRHEGWVGKGRVGLHPTEVG